MAASEHKFTKTPNEFTYAGIVWNDYTTPEIIRRSEKFQFLPSDICVCTFPRSGTTLTQQIIWQIVNKELVRKGQKYGDIDERFPFLEFNSKWSGRDEDEYAIDCLIRQQEQQQEQPRLIKTHCPFSFIGDRLKEAKPKIVTVARNPKDCCVSFFKFYQGLDMFGPWSGDFKEFFELFLAGYTFSGDYFKVVAEWWQLRHEPNVLFMKYEDIVKRPTESVAKIADFLGRKLTQEQLDIICHNSSFDSMYQDPELNATFDTGFRFLRKGVVGDWKSQFTVEQSEIMDKVFEERLGALGLQFEFE